MARIRSLHPGQATDEDFVALSFEARLFALHLRCEADDNGVFEWKPTGLKMKIFPADNVDVDAILAELVDHRQIIAFEYGDKKYGAIRNFRKWQRPKKPTASHPLPDEFRSYVALDDNSSEPVPHQVGTSTEKSPQREDVGGRRKEEGDTTDSSLRSESSAAAPSENDSKNVNHETISRGELEIPLLTLRPPDGDWRKHLFGAGLRFVTSRLGGKEGAHRPLLGKWLKLAHDDAKAVYDVLAQAQLEDAADIKSWVMVRLNKHDEAERIAQKYEAQAALERGTA